MDCPYVVGHPSAKNYQHSLSESWNVFLDEVNILREKHVNPANLIINMDETPMYFDMMPSFTISKKGVKEVRVCSSGAEKRRLTVALRCTGH